MLRGDELEASCVTSALRLKARTATRGVALMAFSFVFKWRPMGFIDRFVHCIRIKPVLFVHMPRCR